MLNKKYRPYICFGLVFILFIVSLFVFKPFIKMMELYTLFVRVNPESLKPVLDFGSDGFMISAVVPMLPSVEFFNYPLILDIFFCLAGVLLSTFLVFFVPNIFIDFCLGLSVIFGYCLFSVYMSHLHSVWIPIIWPVLIQGFMFFSVLTAKAVLKQTKQISTIKLFGYDISKVPNSVPFIKNVVQQPKKTEITMACFKIKVPNLYMEQTPASDLVYNINQVFKTIIECGLKYSGIIDKTSNNTIIIYWLGKNHALNSVKAAMEINSLIQSDIINVSCGISTENSIFAILGSENFANYTVIGNNADIANRLENACIFHNTNLLISKNTLNELKDRLIAAHKGVISVHGIQSQVDFYEPLNFIEDKMSYFDKLKEEFFK